jgi:hypothetical protein
MQEYRVFDHGCGFPEIVWSPDGANCVGAVNEFLLAMEIVRENREKFGELFNMHNFREFQERVKELEVIVARRLNELGEITLSIDGYDNGDNGLPKLHGVSGIKEFSGFSQENDVMRMLDGSAQYDLLLALSPSPNGYGDTPFYEDPVFQRLLQQHLKVGGHCIIHTEQSELGSPRSENMKRIMRAGWFFPYNSASYDFENCQTYVWEKEKAV